MDSIRKQMEKDDGREEHQATRLVGREPYFKDYSEEQRRQKERQLKSEIRAKRE